MSVPETRHSLRVLESDASGWCEPDSDVCAMPGAGSPVSAVQRETGGIDEDARGGADRD
jgi:hypothetical protein